MRYNGYDDYLLAAGLAQTNPVAREAFENEDVEFTPSHSFMPGMNTPQYAQSTFVRQIRKPAHTDIAFVRLGNNGYQYGMTEPEMARWMTSRSLGKFYDEYIRRK